MARVIMAGTFDPEFARNRKLRRLLDLAGHEVETCRVELWGTNRPEIMSENKLLLVGRMLLAYPKLLWKFAFVRRGDVVLVAHPGAFDMIVLSPLARLRRMPIVFDCFISLFDTVVADRQLTSQTSAISRALRVVDRLALRRARRVIADTPTHADYFAELGHVERDRFGIVWLGAQDDVFSPHPEIVPETRRVVFHGTFIALQGLATIVRAAKKLEPDGIEVRIIGTGQEQGKVDALMRELQPANVHLTGLLPLAQVPAEIASATVCLGIFGETDKARRVVPNKLYECLAVGRPVVTADTPAVRAAFRADEVAIVDADAAALADGIRHLVDDPAARERLARAGHDRYAAAYSEVPLSRLLDAELQHVLAGAARSSRQSRRRARTT